VEYYAGVCRAMGLTWRQAADLSDGRYTPKQIDNAVRRVVKKLKEIRG